MEITFQNSITPDQINRLRKAVGFRQLDTEQISAGLAGSQLTLAACEQGEAIGMARLIWDGGGAALVTDVIVLPEYQEQGIEAELVKRILGYLPASLKPRYGMPVDVRAWGSQEEIYQELGFIESTRERRGLPMHICLTEQIELTDSRFGQGDFSPPAS